VSLNVLGVVEAHCTNATSKRCFGFVVWSRMKLLNVAFQMNVLAKIGAAKGTVLTPAFGITCGISFTKL